MGNNSYRFIKPGNKIELNLSFWGLGIRNVHQVAGIPLPALVTVFWREPLLPLAQSDN